MPDGETTRLPSGLPMRSSWRRKPRCVWNSRPGSSVIVAVAVVVETQRHVAIVDGVRVELGELFDSLVGFAEFGAALVKPLPHRVAVKPDEGALSDRENEA